MIGKLDTLAASASPTPWIRGWSSLNVHGMTSENILQRQADIDFAVALVNEWPAISALRAEHSAIHDYILSRVLGWSAHDQYEEYQRVIAAHDAVASLIREDDDAL